MQKLEDDFLASGGKYEEVVISNIFEKIKTKNIKYTAQDLKGKHDERYSLPALTAGVENQGLAYYVPREDVTILKKCISVSANGANTGVMYYQPHEFTVLQDSYAIKYNAGDISGLAYLYLVSALQKSVKGRYDWSNKAGWEKIKYDKITLPYLENKIAFSYMENYIKTLEAERIETLEAYLTVTGLKDYKLTEKDVKTLDKFSKLDDNESRVEEWREYTLEELYGKSTRGKRLKSSDRISGKLPFVTAGEENTGISAYIGNDVEIFEENTITIDMFGSAKYRGYSYGADDHVAVVHSENLSKQSAMFLSKCIDVVSRSGKFSYSRNFYAKDADELTVQLPIKDNEIDYQFMSDFIRVIEKLIIKDLVEWTDEKIQATKEIVG